VSQDIYRGQIERQLSDNIDLLETDRDTLFFDFYKVESKEVPVISQLNVSLSQNYLLDGAIQLVPEKVTIKGPKNEIDTINSVKTRNKTITDLNEDFSISIPLDISSVMENSSFSAYEVKAIGKVFRFSEKILEVPVEVINIPKGTEIKTFPNKVSVLCKAKIAMLKNVEADQFKVIADYAQISLNEASLEVHLIDIPDHVHSAQLQENRVDFILKRQ
jgi:YbbR domain-containing protein